MSSNIYLENEAKKGFIGWTKEGWDFLLHNELYKNTAVDSLAKILEYHQSVEFSYNNVHYEIFASCESGYIVNIYSSDEKDEFGHYLQKNNIDGGLCTGNCKDAVEFML